MDLILLILTLILTPLIFCPLKSCDGFILPQIAVGSLGISLTLIFFIGNGLLPISLPIGLALLYFIYISVTNAWSTVPHNSLRDMPLIFLCIGSFIIASSLFTDRGNMVAVSLGIFFVSMFTSLYAIGQKFLFDPLFPERLFSKRQELEDNVRSFDMLDKGEDFEKAAKTGKLDWQLPKFFNNRKWADSRSISTLGNTTFAAGYFCSTLPFILFLGVEVNTWFLLSLVIPITAIIFTESRASLLGLFMAVVFFLLYVSQRGILVDCIFWLGSFGPEILTLVMILILYLSVEFLIRTHNIWKGLTEDTWLNNTLDVEHTHQDHPVAHLRFRFRYWRAAWELIKKKPIQGFGLRTYRKEVYQAQADFNLKDGGKFLGDGYQTPQPRECHNDFIENFVEGGFTTGLLFLVLLGIIFFNSFDYAKTADLKEFLLVGAVISGMITLLVTAFFFFPLRLGSSALTFWVSLALLQGISSDIMILPTSGNGFVVFFLILALIAFNWEGVIKSNIGNFLFSKHQWDSNPNKKEYYLSKASDFCPKETIFQTHRYQSYIHTIPDEAEQCTDVARHFYDGMTPIWVMFFNSAVVKMKKRNYSDAVRMLNHSLYHLPYFKPARELLGKIYPLAPFPRRGVILKRINDESINGIAFLEADIGKMEVAIQVSRERIVNFILSEKVRMNVPVDWIFDFRHKIFILPTEIPSDGQLIELGPSRLPVIVNKNAVNLNPVMEAK